MKTHSLTESFSNAWRGICTAFESEKNMKIHFGFALLVLLSALILKVSLVQVAILVLTITVVIAVELVNTAIEKTIDLISLEYSELAGKVKDMAAGAVMVTALGAIMIGLIVFGPYLMKLFN